MSLHVKSTALTIEGLSVAVKVAGAAGVASGVCERMALRPGPVALTARTAKVWSTPLVRLVAV